MRCPRAITALAPLLSVLLAALGLAGGPLAGSAAAEAPQWRLEQPTPPEPGAGVPGSETPVGLGRIGDIEFWAPNRGLLTTAGNGSTIPPGIWAYNGQGWHELASVCGATNGRIAWAGPDEFWTVADGRPGQAANGRGVLPPLEDNTLCHFTRHEPGNSSSALEVAKSYAALAFQASEYNPMHAAACVAPNNCWFAGAPLPAPQLGAFHLHWNGTAVEPEPNTKVESVQDMRVFQGSLYESIGLPLEPPAEGEESEEEILHPSVLQEVSPEGVSPAFKPLHPSSASSQILPEYAPGSAEFPFGSFPQALGALHLSADGDSLWAGAGATPKPPAGSAPGALTVLRDSGGHWSQVLGPATEHTAEAEAEHTGKAVPEAIAGDALTALAAEPGSTSAWLSLDTHGDLELPNPTLPATVAHLAADGSLSEEQLPSESERKAGIGPKGAAAKIVCPAPNDCWMATTQGWLFHLSEAAARTLPANGDPSFSGPLITYRPPDEGLPQVQPDAPPADDSGLTEGGPSTGGPVEKPQEQRFAAVTVPLLSSIHTRVRGTTLELSFRLAVKARVRLLARRHASVVASTPMRTLGAGKRTLTLRLNRNRWPTKLELQTHALAPLPQESTRSSSVESVSTRLAFPDTRTLDHGLWPLVSGPTF
jgi:hypothetical protein